MAEESAKQAAAEIRKVISIGFGTFLATASALYLAWRGLTWKDAGSN